jgi:prepilin-type N-terminal cleavage/methylation domain-containing protein
MLTHGLRRRRRDGREEDGFTLVELLVSIILLGVVGSVASAAILTATQTQRSTDGLVTARTEATKAIERISRDLRVANPLRVADANDVTVDTLRGSTCERRRYYVDGANRLMLSIAPFTTGTACGVYGAVPGTATSTVIADAVVTGGTPIFSYLRWDGSTSQRVAVTAPVAASSLGLVDGVVISVTVPAAPREPVTVSTQVDLRNVEIS